MPGCSTIDLAHSLIRGADDNEPESLTRAGNRNGDDVSNLRRPSEHIIHSEARPGGGLDSEIGARQFATRIQFATRRRRDIKKCVRNRHRLTEELAQSLGDVRHPFLLQHHFGERLVDKQHPLELEPAFALGLVQARILECDRGLLRESLEDIEVGIREREWCPKILNHHRPDRTATTEDGHTQCALRVVKPTGCLAEQNSVGGAEALHAFARGGFILVAERFTCCECLAAHRLARTQANAPYLVSQTARGTHEKLAMGLVIK